MNGHYAPNYVTNEVWGLSWLDDDVYATCGDDGTVRLWSLRDHAQVMVGSLLFDGKLKPLKLKGKFLPEQAVGRCICVAASGHLVVGCKDGTVKVLDGDLRSVSSLKLCKKEISAVKFSPDSTTLAIGAHDGVIYVFQWSDGAMKLRSKSIHHNSYIKHFDFSRDGNYLHSTCGAYELLFWDINTGKQLTAGATMTRDEEWASWSLTLGWPVQGVWEPFMDGTDVNAVDRSNNTYQKGMRLLASGNDMGKVRIQQYPCLTKNSQSVVGRGHSSHVTNIRFSRDDKFLLSTGGEDQTVLQWKVTPK